MRWVLVAAFLVGCSSESPATVTDAGGKTCANTSCVEGASCTTRDGTVCRCLTVGTWTCSDAATPEADTEFGFDVGPSPEFDSGVADTGENARTVTECFAAASVCDGESPTAGAELHLRTFWESCGGLCTNLTLYSESGSGCPRLVVANGSWTSGALDCIAKQVAQYTWECATEFHVTTCLD